jgi:tRNA pseudouridine32 synthase/23S rRNA pseudouridine746 synthase
LQSSHKTIHSDREIGAPESRRFALATHLVHRRFVLLSDRILFIDGEALVLDKPAGLPVDRPRRGGESIMSRLDELRCGFQRPPTPMHRLDTDTSGCLLFARSPKARVQFQKAFEARAVEKSYVAVVGAEIDEEAGVIDVALAKTSSAEAGWKMVADEHGLEATTHWRRLAVRDGSTLVEFRPVTGRTHQIRIHAREAFGSGIVGDRVYGMPGGPMLLHASRLVVPRIGKPAIDVTALLPDTFGEWRDVV